MNPVHFQVQGPVQRPSSSKQFKLSVSIAIGRGSIFYPPPPPPPPIKKNSPTTGLPMSWGYHHIETSEVSGQVESSYLFKFVTD